MAKIWSLPLLLPIFVSIGRVEAQTSQVTFYSAASRAKLLAPHSDEAGFYGYIYDGPTKLVALGDGRRATFILPAGEHTFSASFSKHPAQNSQLILSMAAGSSYFVSAEAHVVNVYYPIWIVLHRGILNQVDCQSAKVKLTELKPVELKRVAKDVRQTLAPDPQPVNCGP